MLIKTLGDLAPGKGEIGTDSWFSHRLLHKEDGMGVTLTRRRSRGWLDEIWWYKNHSGRFTALKGKQRLKISASCVSLGITWVKP